MGTNSLEASLLDDLSSTSYVTPHADKASCTHYIYHDGTLFEVSEKIALLPRESLDPRENSHVDRS